LGRDVEYISLMIEKSQGVLFQAAFEQDVFAG
jgi:hypothetical protein